MRVRDILKITHGKLLSGKSSADIDLAKVSTDSRSIRKGEFFIALSGPNHCGSDHVAEALGKGATGAITEKGVSPGCVKGDRILIKVKNSGKALRDIAASHRREFDIPVICVTGSNGKTTVKEMVAAVLSARYKVLKNEGTKNNNIGVPQTLLKLDSGHDMCVLELGTNHKGEIGELVKIAVPTAAIITNIGQSHLEHFTDLEGVYKEKKHILDPLKKGSFAVVSGDDPILSRIGRAKYRIVRYGLGKSNDFRASAISASGRGLIFTAQDGTVYSLDLIGTHNVYNALAAIAVGAQFGIKPKEARKALSAFKPASMRLNQLEVNGLRIVNDSYNSNPSSMKSALEAIGACPAGAKWVVCGDMLELGRKAPELHRQAGKLVADSGASGLLTMGKLSVNTVAGAVDAGMLQARTWHFDNHDDIAAKLKRITRDGDVVLIKGSRGMKMERVIEKLRG